MRYKTKDIGEAGLEVDLPITEAWLDESCAALDVRPSSKGLNLRGRFEFTGTDTYLLRGDLRGELNTPCGRCLETASVQLDAPFIASYVERETLTDDEAESDEEFVAFTGDSIDIGSEVRDEIVMNVPMASYCRPDCKGLCPVCGGNRNDAPCDCEEQQRLEASKFSALTKIKL